MQTIAIVMGEEEHVQRVGPLQLALALASDHQSLFSQAISTATAATHTTAADVVRALAQAADKTSGNKGDSLPSISTIHEILLYLLDDPDVAECLDKNGVGARRIRAEVERLSSSAEAQPINKVKSVADFSRLKVYGRDLVEESWQHDPVIGRDEEIRRVIQILCRRTKNNPVLVGEAGVGKTAVVEGFAKRVACGDVPSALAGARVLALHSDALSYVASLVKEVKEFKEKGEEVILFIDEIHTVVWTNAANHLKPMLARGELRCIGATTLEEYRANIEKDAAFERRFQQVYVAEPSVADTISILRGLKYNYADHHKVRISDEALVAAAQLSKRYISGRRLPDKAIDLLDEACSLVQLQLHCRPEEIDRLDRKRTQLAIELHTIEEEDNEDLGEYSSEDSRDRAQEISNELDALERALEELSNKHEKEKEEKEKVTILMEERNDLKMRLKDAMKAMDMDEIAELEYKQIPKIEAAITNLRRRIKKKEAVGFDHIAMVVSQWTGIPVTRLGQQEKVKLIGLGESLHRRIIGQDEAIDAIAKAVVRARVGLSRPQQPMSSFLFLGPTGVGKTELAKALAEELFNDEKLIIRLDMSEYMEPHSISKLIGPPPGYIGYDEAGQLTKAVRQRPYSVILFDEIEKAHVDVFNTLLQVLDDGRLTDNHGMTADFSNTLIIMTSNLGACHLCAAAVINKPSSRQRARDRVMQEVRKHFSPEFLNRLDEIVVFDPLTRQQLREVTTLQINNVARRLANKSITVVTSEAAVDVVLDRSYDPTYGARPMRRWLEKNVVTELSNMLLREDIDTGSKVYIDAAEGMTELTYSTVEKNGKQVASVEVSSSVKSDSSSPT